MWGLGSTILANLSGGTPIVSVAPPTVTIEAVQINPGRSGSGIWMYRNGDTHPMKPGESMDWWGKGTKIDEPEWVNGRDEDNNYVACVLRNAPITLIVKFVATTSVDLAMTVTLTPKVDDSTRFLTAVTESVTYPAGSTEHWFPFTTGGAMPDEIGRYGLKLDWSVTGTGFRYGGPTRSRLKIYGIYDTPRNPGYDSATDADTGTTVPTSDGTLTGTKKRFDKLMRLIGGSDRRHAAATADNVIDILWELHRGINNTPGAAPYFDAGHDEYLTDDGNSHDTGAHDIPLEDQWLAWVTTSDPHWNDASCIGHVQILKTMAAAAGLFGRRTWVFPTTSKPAGTTVTLADTDLYCLGNYDSSNIQSRTFSLGAFSVTAHPKLMEPDGWWENFEACLRTPNGRFLPGGYNTSSWPSSFSTDKGFRTAAELIRRWSNTTRPSFGKRFLAWVYISPLDERHYWDVDGNHYTVADYTDIRDDGKELPPP